MTITFLPATAFSKVILFHVVPGAVPCTKIAPSKRSGDHIYVIGLFHYTEINGNIGALGIDLIQ